MPQYRYENRNPYPVSIPGQRGVTVVFASGQFATDPWFSRFCGAKQLTRVATTGSAKKLAPKVAPPAPPQPPMLSHVEQTRQGETNDWAKKSGIYYCKHCELFRTGSRIAIENHLSSYHQLDKADQDLETPPVKALPEAKTPAPPAAGQPLAETPVTREPVVSGAVTQPKSTPQAFTCPACGRMYKTEGGLERHTKKVHSGAAEGAPQA